MDQAAIDKLRAQVRVLRDILVTEPTAEDRNIRRAVVEALDRKLAAISRGEQVARWSKQ